MRYAVVTGYYRQKQFDYYRQYRNPFYSMTFELDATALKAFIDHNGYRTYLNLCYFLTRAAQGIEDFRYRLRDGQLVLYERLDPGLTVPAANGGFGWSHFEYDEDVHVFNRRAAAEWPSPDEPADMTPKDHDNQIYFTAIPGAVFTGFTHTWDDPSEGAARVAFGQLFERDDRLLVPVGIQVNHIFIDGRALGELTRRAQEEFDSIA
jgi:chloramphenicol O-acetyltransferase type A